MESTHADARPSLDCPGSPWIGSIDPRDHPDVAAAVAALGDEVISPYCLWCLQGGFVARAHEEALGVLPWTVNEPSDLDAVREAGVDGPVTDYPDRVALPRPA